MRGMNQFAKAWDHTLNIRHIFSEAGQLPAAADTIKMGAEIVAAIRSLQKRISDTSDLWHDLDDCCEGFEDLSGIENDYEARERFNEALHKLYDEADYAKRVWIA